MIAIAIDLWCRVIGGLGGGTGPGGSHYTWASIPESWANQTEDWADI